VECRDRDGWTPLKTAAHHGHLNDIQFLVDCGADVNTRDNEDRTPVQKARTIVTLCSSYSSMAQIPEIVRPLTWHLTQGRLEVADLASSISLDSAANTTPSTVGSQNKPPNGLHPPGKRGEGETSSDIEQCLVYAASMNGQLDIVRSLLDHGSDANERNTICETALNAASRYGEPEVAMLLIERGAVVDSRNGHGWTPLISASRYGQLEVARLLLDHGANVNAKTRDLLTALHLASTYGHFEVVQLLLGRGADMYVRKANGQTPRQVAIQLGHRRVAKLLLTFGEHG
jgi:ankyrin repeat protein